MTRGRGRPRMYKFGEIAVGEHFDVELRSFGHRISVASAARQFSQRYGGTFRTEVGYFDVKGNWCRVDNKTFTHVRVTRIA